MSLIRSLVLGSACLALVTSSAIPMWEFLTRGEKMSHLFNMFVKQVAEHCDSSNMPDCQKVLLVYGLTNLAKMEDDSLDKMDPYQRGANDIIWESMMHGSYKKKTDEHRDYYTDALEPSGGDDGNQLGSQEEASSKVESPYPGGSSGYNVLGPMVVRVRPDGSPVPEDPSPLPKDEDKEEYQVMRAQPIPSIEEVQSGKHYSQHRYSSIADILGHEQVEASTYKPHRRFTSIEDLLSGHRSPSPLRKQLENDFDVLTPPPGYVHHESLSEIEERFQEEQKKKNQSSLSEAPTTRSEHREEPSPAMSSIAEIVARHVSTSVTSSRKARHN